MDFNVQYFAGLVPLSNVNQSFKALLGDAVLWVHNNHKELDMELMKKKIVNLEVLDVENLHIERVPPR